MRWYLRAAALDQTAIRRLAFAFQRGDTLLPQSDLGRQYAAGAGARVAPPEGDAVVARPRAGATCNIAV